MLTGSTPLDADQGDYSNLIAFGISSRDETEEYLSPEP